MYPYSFLLFLNTNVNVLYPHVVLVFFLLRVHTFQFMNRDLNLPPSTR